MANRNSLLQRALNKAIKASLDPIEVQWGYHLVPGAELKNVSIEGKLPRIALVKQEVYQDLYCCPPHASARDIVLSSLKRTGPVGLFTGLKADFWIIKTEEDPECNVWKEKWFDCQQKPIEFYESLKTEPFLGGERGHQYPQGTYSVAASEVDWSAYDIVISLDISIPARITQKYPMVTWCYYIGEPCMSSYGKSLKQPIQGYDLFLNQKFRHLRFPSTAAHEIEFPYMLQYYGCFHDLMSQDIKDSERQGVVLESHTAQELTDQQLQQLEQLGPVRITAGKTEDIILALMKSKYFARLSGRRLWGNALIEAVAAGCLAIGDPKAFVHCALFTPGTSAKTFEQILKKLNEFENNSALYEIEVNRQRSLLNHLCFNRPLSDLVEKSQRVMRSRSTQ